MSGLFGRRRENLVIENWRFTANSVIWRVVISDDGYFVCEDRDKDSKSVSFSCVERMTGKVMWRDLRLSEPWWTGVEAVHKNYVFFHEYATPDMPDHKKIQAHSLLTGERIWQNDNEKFLFAANESVFTVRELFERRVFSQLDLATGAYKGELQPEFLDSLRSTVLPLEVTAAFPAIVDPLRMNDPRMKRVIEKATVKAKNVILVELLRSDFYNVIGFYDNRSQDSDHPDVNQYVAIIDSRSETISYFDTISIGVSAPIPDTFFSVENHIYLVKDKKILTSLELIK